MQAAWRSATRARALLTDAYQRLGLDAAATRGARRLSTLNAIPDGLLRTPAVADSAASAGFALLAANKYDDAVAAFRRAARRGAGTRRSRFARGQRDEARTGRDARRE